MTDYTFEVHRLGTNSSWRLLVTQLHSLSFSHSMQCESNGSLEPIPDLCDKSDATLYINEQVMRIQLVCTR